MHKLFRFLKPYWWQIILLLIVIAVQVFTTLQLPALMADIINNGIVPGDTDYIWSIGKDMILLTILSAVCSVVSGFLSARIGAYFARDVRMAIFQKTLNLNLTDLKDFSTASLANRTTNDVNQVQQTMMMMLSMLVRAPMFCIISLIMAIQTAPDMSFIIAIGIALVISATLAVLIPVIPKFKIFQKIWIKLLY